MYKDLTARRSRARLADRQLCVAMAIAIVLTSTIPPGAGAQEPTVLEPPASVVRHISGPSEKLEITTNSSRILTLDKKIPRVQVNNPELLAVTPLSANQVQVSAKKAGVTQVNLWDEDGKIHTVDVYIYGDVRELEHAYKTQFPHSAIKVYRYSGSLVLAGFVDRPDYVDPILRLAEDYSPKVINNIQVGGVQQVLLKVKIFEVSRTKLRRLGTDWAYLGGSGDFAINSVSGLIGDFSTGGGDSVVDAFGDTFAFGIVDGDSAFFGFLDALQENRIAKILAEPNLVAISGRPAQFLEGGEVPVLVPQSLGTTSIEYKPFGTQVDFLPIVLGNGNIRLEVRPQVSDIDPSIGIELQGIRVDGFRMRRVDTAVEMRAGQTFALAGLIQRKTDTLNRGLPYLSDLPIIGLPFRKTEEEVNEIELLILVTPEFVDPLDPCEAPICGPGMGSMSPDNCELYWGGHVEVPNMCNECGPQGCVPTHGHEPCCPGDPWGSGCAPGGPAAYGPTPYHENGPMHGPETQMLPTPAEAVPIGDPAHGELALPPAPQGASLPRGGQQQMSLTAPRVAQRPTNSRPQPPRPARPPQYVRNPSKPFNPTWGQPTRPQATASDGLIGPVGYDAD
ncbi:MAG: type II and III secretion system protein family protein [Pirellulales bacterium]